MHLLKELARFSTQHRTVYCYLVLSFWVFFLLAAMYKYIENTNNNYLNSLNIKEYSSTTYDEINEKLVKYQQYCSPNEFINKKDDVGIIKGWKLQGVLIVIRHGDRGPLSHVKGISSIDCGVQNNSLLDRYKAFLFNTTGTSGSTGNWNRIGPFHGFSLLPSDPKACLLGQLTYKGIAQLLHIGEILHKIYANPLGMLTKTQFSRLTINTTPETIFNTDEIIVYSTRYRRTFQSAMALLYSFLPPEKWLTLNIRESHSSSFCFSDCACPRVDKLQKKLSRISNEQLQQHPAVSKIVQLIGSNLLHKTTNSFLNPNVVRDAVMSIICHKAFLPCRKVIKKNHLIMTTTSTTIENDFINIDQDDTLTNAIDTVPNIDESSDTVSSQIEGCIETSDIAALMTYTNWQLSKESQHNYYRQIGILRAYGMIRHIVSIMLKMISGGRTKFVLYSAHDVTSKFLTAALGIGTETAFISYGSRIAFEIYRSEMNTDYYFRVLYNGKDVTKQIDFCENGKSLRLTRDNRGNIADLCPIENIIRFIHDDYFTSLNATNFKDACTIK